MRSRPRRGKRGESSWRERAGRGISGHFAPRNGGRVFAIRAKFAGGEIVEGAEAVLEFQSGKALLTVEPVEEIARAVRPFASCTRRSRRRGCDRNCGRRRRNAPKATRRRTGFADRSPGDADGAGEPLNGEAEARLSFEAAVAQEMRIDGPIEDGKTQPHNEYVLHLLPDVRGIDHFDVHVFFQRGKAAGPEPPCEAQGTRPR